MEFNIIGGTTYPALEVALTPGDEVVAEAGAMAWMDTHVQCKTSARGGVLAGLSRALLSKESFFQNTYSVASKPGTVTLVPGSPGAIMRYELAGELFLQKSAYLASDPGVELQSKFEGLKGLFNEGLFVLRAVGNGTLFFSGYGDCEVIDVDGEYVVDNGYAAAWEPTLSYRISKAKKIRSFLFSDQLLLRFSGRGKVYVQSRSPQALANFFYPYRPVKDRG